MAHRRRLLVAAARGRGRSARPAAMHWAWRLPRVVGIAIDPCVRGGVTLTTSAVGGSISFIPSGQFAGLWLGNANNSGRYTLGFSQSLGSIEIEFDALSSVGRPPPETLSAFATSNGPATISYLNQFGTTFDGTTITSTENDGQGTISYAGASSFVRAAQFVPRTAIRAAAQLEAAASAARCTSPSRASRSSATCSS